VTDAPDFAPAVLPAPAVFLAALGPFAAGGNWGPVNVKVPSGGSYHLAIFPSVAADFCCTDVVVSHLDSRGIPAYQDFFGGVLAGNGSGGVAGNANAAVCRGNLYGNTLQISGTTANSAFLNAVLPPGGFTATGLSINVYSTPFALADPQPKVTVAGANIASFLSLTPQTVIAQINDQVVAAATSSAVQPVLAYAGPAVLEILQTGIAAAANAQLLIAEYTVANGSANVWARRRVKGLASGQYAVFRVNLGPLLRTWQFINADPANAATVDMLLTGGSAA